jgi:hypothetical protein
MAYRGDTIGSRLLADETFLRLVNQRDANGDRLRASDIHQVYGGETFCSRATIERTVRRARELQPPEASQAPDAAPPTNELVADAPTKPTQRQQLLAATVAPPTDTARPDPIVEELRARVRLLEEQLTYHQRANPAHHTGGKYTLVISDVHKGDRAHMPRSYGEMWQKALVHMGQFSPEIITVIDNGDHIAGRGIYRNQNMDAVLQSTEEQVRAGAIDLYQRDKAIRDRFPDAVVKWRITHGNHDMSMGERTSPLLVMSAKFLGVDAVYCGDSTIVNLAARGTHNLWAEHGYGYSGISPSAPKWLSDMKDRLLVMQREYFGENRIRRVTHGHTHWAQVGMQRVLDVFFDCTGGCQRNERIQLGKNSRPMGFIGYVSPAEYDGILEPILLQPSIDLQIEETRDPYLFQRNMEECSVAIQIYDERMRELGIFDLVDIEGR